MRVGIMIYPLLVQVGLTFGLVSWLGVLRLRAATRREVSLRDIALDNSAWPMRIKQVGNSYGNQFELPLLFYLVCVLVMLEGTPDRVINWLAWAFVASRLVHAFIHVTSNDVPLRFYAFVAGVASLALMWLRFAWPHLAAIA